MIKTLKPSIIALISAIVLIINPSFVSDTINTLRVTEFENLGLFLKNRR